MFRLDPALSRKFLTGSRSMTGISEPLRKVGAVLAVERYVLAIDVKLHTPAVELDFVQPVRAGRRYLRQRRGHRFDKWDFTQHAADVGFVNQLRYRIAFGAQFARFVKRPDHSVRSLRQGTAMKARQILHDGGFIRRTWCGSTPRLPVPGSNSRIGLAWRVARTMIAPVNDWRRSLLHWARVHWPKIPNCRP